MSTAELNLVLAATIWVLATLVGISHWRERGWRGRWWLLGVSIWMFASLLLITGGAQVGPGRDFDRNVLSIIASAFRGAILVVIANYAYHRLVLHDTPPPP